MLCPTCSHDVPQDAARCVHCESELGDPTQTVAPENRWIVELPQFHPGRVFAGRFTIVEQVARGGMSVVYKAIDRELGGEVALKLLPPELAARADYVERFRREVRVTRQINHPNVCRVFDLGSDHGILYFFMEWVKGETLRELLQHTNKLPEDRALEFAEKVARALEAAHAHGVIHRDLKPSNVMIEKGEVRVMDFGVATETGPHDWTTLYGAPGTPEYMAPEQRRGGVVDARTDLYALGLLLAEMLTGDPRGAVEGRAASVVAQLRAEDPAQRFVNAAAAAQAIAALRGLAATPAKEPVHRHRLRSAAFAGIAALSLAIIVWRAIQRPTDIFYRRGLEYLREAETVPVMDDAILMFNRAILEDSLHARAWAGKGEAYWMRYERTKEQTSRAEAERAVEHAVQLKPKMPEVRLARARGMLALGKAQDARDILIKLTREKPGMSPAWASLGRADQRLNKYDEGLTALRRAIRINPTSARHHIELGVFFQRNEEYKAAEMEFLRALELKRESPTAWLNLGASYLNQNEPEKAVQALTNSLKYEQRPAAYANLGTAHYYLHHYDQAAESYLRATELEPVDPLNPYNLGDAYRMMGRSAAADSAYRVALVRARPLVESAPDNMPMRTQLAQIHARLGDGKNALAEIGIVLHRDPHDVDALFTKATILAMLHRDGDAVGCLEDAIRLGLGKAAILNDPDLTRLKGEPGFERVLQLAS